VCDNYRRIDEVISKVAPEHTAAVNHMRKDLDEIRARIEGRKHRNRFAKWSAYLRLYGAQERETILFTLQEYQMRASVYGNTVVEEIKGCVSRHGIPGYINRLLEPVIVYWHSLDILTGIQEKLSTTQEYSYIQLTGQ